MEVTTLLTMFCSVLLASPPKDTDTSQEPPLKITVTIDGKPIESELDQELVIKGEFKDPKVRVRAAKTRRFNYAGVTFDYPSYFTWEYEREGSIYHNWTMSGNNCMVMLMEFSVEMTAKELVENMEEEISLYGKPTPTTRTFKNTNLKGAKIAMRLSDSSSDGEDIQVVQEVLEIPTPKGRSRLLLLQELTPDDPEAQVVLDLLSKTFSIDEPSNKKD